MQEVSKTVNEVLGTLCAYTHKDTSVTADVYITIDRNKAVKDDFQTLVGYRVEASILKSDIPVINNMETFLDEHGVTWRINQITKETGAKFYVDIIEMAA